MYNANMHTHSYAHKNLRFPSKSLLELSPRTCNLNNSKFGCKPSRNLKFHSLFSTLSSYKSPFSWGINGKDWNYPMWQEIGNLIVESIHHDIIFSSKWFQKWGKATKKALFESQNSKNSDFFNETLNYQVEKSTSTYSHNLWPRRTIPFKEL